MFGITIEQELSEVGVKRSKDHSKHEMARKRILKKYGIDQEQMGNSGFADPAKMFKN